LLDSQAFGTHSSIKPPATQRPRALQTTSKPASFRGERNLSVIDYCSDHLPASLPLLPKQSNTQELQIDNYIRPSDHQSSIGHSSAACIHLVSPRSTHRPNKQVSPCCRLSYLDWNNFWQLRPHFLPSSLHMSRPTASSTSI
jgi:hypothetical protein